MDTKKGCLDTGKRCLNTERGCLDNEKGWVDTEVVSGYCENDRMLGEAIWIVRRGCLDAAGSVNAGIG